MVINRKIITDFQKLSLIPQQSKVSANRAAYYTFCTSSLRRSRRDTINRVVPKKKKHYCRRFAANNPRRYFLLCDVHRPNAYSLFLPHRIITTDNYAGSIKKKRIIPPRYGFHFGEIALIWNNRSKIYTYGWRSFVGREGQVVFVPSRRRQGPEAPRKQPSCYILDLWNQTKIEDLSTTYNYKRKIIRKALYKDRSTNITECVCVCVCVMRGNSTGLQQSYINISTKKKKKK